MRQRLAPMAFRTAISRERDAARASRRFATFAHAISSTKPTAASSTSRDARMSPTKYSRRGVSVTPLPVFSFGYSSASCAAMAFISVSACSKLTPSLSRA